MKSPRSSFPSLGALASKHKHSLTSNALARTAQSFEFRIRRVAATRHVNHSRPKLIRVLSAFSFRRRRRNALFSARTGSLAFANCAQVILRTRPVHLKQSAVMAGDIVNLYAFSAHYARVLSECCGYYSMFFSIRSLVSRRDSRSPMDIHITWLLLFASRLESRPLKLVAAECQEKSRIFAKILG